MTVNYICEKANKYNHRLADIQKIYPNNFNRECFRMYQKLEEINKGAGLRLNPEHLQQMKFPQNPFKGMYQSMSFYGLKLSVSASDEKAVLSV